MTPPAASCPGANRVPKPHSATRTSSTDHFRMAVSPAKRARPRPIHGIASGSSTRQGGELDKKTGLARVWGGAGGLPVRRIRCALLGTEGRDGEQLALART